MLPERAEQMLKDYMPFVGRCDSLRVMVRSLKREIDLRMAEMALDNGIGAQNLDGMPHGTTVGNPTERYALMFVSGYVPEDVKQLRQTIEQCEAEIREKEITVMFVDAWLKGLTAKERWMIESVYFNRMSYNEINPRYREEYGESCSKDSLRRIKKEALAKIFEMAK